MLDSWWPCHQGLFFTQSARNPSPLHLVALPFPGGGGLLSTFPQGLVREDVTQNLNISPWPEFSHMAILYWSAPCPAETGGGVNGYREGGDRSKVSGSRVHICCGVSCTFG